MNMNECRVKLPEDKQSEWNGLNRNEMKCQKRNKIS